MRFSAVLVVTASLALTSACSHANSGSSSSSAAAKSSGGGKASGGSAKESTVPDPHASTTPNVGRQAGVGDDPSNLEAADPRENGGDSGKAGPAQKP